MGTTENAERDGFYVKEMWIKEKIVNGKTRHCEFEISILARNKETKES